MSNADIHARIDALIAEDRLEEALRLTDQLEPISLEEFRRILDEAPLDDEPVSPEQREALDRAWEVIRDNGQASRTAGCPLVSGGGGTTVRP
jgi:hypothetical protein